MQATLPVEQLRDVNAPEDFHPFRVVVIYDNLSAGQRAMITLTSLVDQFRGGRVELRPQLWRFDLLESTAWFDLALADGICADMLIVSTSRTEGLPAKVSGWLTLCLARKQGTGAAIVALPGSAGESDTPRFHFLKSAAVDAGLEFFTPRSSAAPGASLPAAIRSQPSAGMIRQAQPYQHGGLNE